MLGEVSSLVTQIIRHPNQVTRNCSLVTWRRTTEQRLLSTAVTYMLPKTSK